MKSFHLENVEDLGITIDSHLQFYQHCFLVISNINRMLCIIAKLLKVLNGEMSLAICITMGHPILEYGDLICGLHFKFNQIQ